MNLNLNLDDVECKKKRITVGLRLVEEEYVELKKILKKRNIQFSKLVDSVMQQILLDEKNKSE